MNSNFKEIQDLLRIRAELQARLNLIPYDGTIEIKKVFNIKIYIKEKENFQKLNQ